MNIFRVIVIVSFLYTGLGWTQTAVTATGSPATQSQQLPNALQLPDSPGSNTPAKRKQQQSEGEQTKRMFWLIPNFGAVNANTQLPPLSVREKFAFAAHDSVLDYSSFTWAGVLAGQAMLLNSDPELGHGIVGYGRYYWRTFADGVSGAFFTEAIVPTITHEDPRYYTMGEGGFLHRTGYALSRPFVTRTDVGGRSYYPPQERGLSQTARNWGTGPR